MSLIDFWRADSQSLSVAVVRNYPMCKNGLERRRSRKPRDAVCQATIAAISGLIPTIFMTRVRL